MSAGKPLQGHAPRTATPGSLLSQWWTLGDIILDRRTNGSGRHIKVAWVIIDRYMQAKGNGRASVRFIQQATGLSKGIIIKACRELVDWGYMTQRIGIGTRPTEYSPNWSSVSPASNAESILASVPQESNASVSPESNTTDFSVPPESNESYLPEPADKAELQVGRNINTHDALPSAGLSAATAGTRDPRSAFDTFWHEFPRKFQKPKARAAWDKIAPDADLAERIIVAASALSVHYASQGTEKKWIPTPANWLAGERYDEDLPDVYADPKEAAIAKAKDREPKTKPANSNTPPSGINDAYIIGIEQVNDAYHHDFRLTLTLQYDEGGQYLTYPMDVNTITGPGADRDAFLGLCSALEPYNLQDISQATGLPVKTATLGKGKLGFGKSFAVAREVTEEVEIVSSKMLHDEGEDLLEVIMKTPNGMDLVWYATHESPSQEEQETGRKEIAELLNAVGVATVDDESELIGKTLTVCRKVRTVVAFLPHQADEQQAA